MRKLKLALLGTASLLAFSSFATTQYSLQMGGYDFELLPQESVDVNNPFFFSLSAKCTVQIIQDVKDSSIAVSLKKKSATVNNQKLDKQNSLILKIKDKDIFKIYASSGASVSLKNQSAALIKAHCTTG